MVVQQMAPVVHQELSLQLELPSGKSAAFPVLVSTIQGSSSSSSVGAVLLHGAGGGMRSGHLGAFAEALAAGGCGENCCEAGGRAGFSAAPFHRPRTSGAAAA